MEIKILAFGEIAEVIGNSEMKINDLKNTNELNVKLIELYPALASIKFAMAVNQKVVQSITMLNNADVVALLPPFSGG